MTEKDLQIKLVAFMKSHNIYHYKTHGGMVYLPTKGDRPYKGTNGKWFAKNGFQIAMYNDSNPDILVFHKTRTFGIELKSESGKLRPNQEQQFLKLYYECNMPIFIMRPSHWEQIKKVYKLTGDILETCLVVLKGGFSGEK